MKRFALVLLSIGMFMGLGMFASAASAQSDECVLPDIADFTDPDTGDIDIDAYTEALAAAQDECDGDVLPDVVAAGGLARTGSNSGELAIAGAALVLVGGGVVVASKMRAGTSA